MKLPALLCWLFMVFSHARAGDLPLIAIQPLGTVKASEIDIVKAGILARYAVSVEILPAQPLPRTAWYEPRRRYKADEILDFLTPRDPRFQKILAITTSDISTTNEKGNDWGILGLGQLGGRACVVSTFRMRAGKADGKKFAGRLVKIVNHELGHNFGLDHCPVEHCLMQDARGKIATIDGESGIPCGDCSSRLPLVRP